MKSCITLFSESLPHINHDENNTDNDGHRQYDCNREYNFQFQRQLTTWFSGCKVSADHTKIVLLSIVIKTKLFNSVSLRPTSRRLKTANAKILLADSTQRH